MPGFSPPLILFVELIAVFVGALSGALSAARASGYGVMGMSCLAFAAGLGGSLTRDLLLQQGTPVALSRVDYLSTVVVAIPVAMLFGRSLTLRGERVIGILDAVGLGWFAIAGTLRALQFELEPAAAAALGMVTAIGGGILRDLLMGRVPTVFRPGELYAMAALLGILVLFVLRGLEAPAVLSVALAISAGVGVRLVSMGIAWRHLPLKGGAI